MKQASDDQVVTSAYQPAEFDEFAADYDAGMGHPLKRMLGDSASAYIDVKVRWLERRLRHRNGGVSPDRDMQLLDFGCGDGLFLDRLTHYKICAQCHGCDISKGMLAAAAERLAGRSPEFHLIENGRVDCGHSTFDCVIVSAVLHHIPVVERAATYRELFRVMKPGGACFVFEHNPFHPIVRHVVRNTPIDANAILLTPREVREGLRSAGFENASTRWLMFFPPRWSLFWRTEPWLERMPLGGQYVVAVEKP